MKIIFSDHAKLKIRQRKLPLQPILETIAHPDFRQPGYRGRVESFKRFGARSLKVVSIPLASSTIVVTAHWIAKPLKKE